MVSNRDDFGNSCSCNWNMEKTEFRSSIGESKCSSEAVNDTIVDRLPADPFGMEIRSTLAAAIKGWIHDFENDFGSNFCVFSVQDSDEKNMADRQHLRLNCVWNGSMGFQQEECKQDEDNLEINQPLITNDDFNGYGIGNGLFIGSFVLNDEGRVLEDYQGVCCEGSEGGVPNDALFFTLGYLGVKDLLVVEMVCRSLRDAVRNDPLLWSAIHIEQSLSMKITDDALLKVTSRAQGSLEHLSVVGCSRITGDGLKLVLESNPRLTKLSVPECTRISIEGILFNLRAFKSTASPGIKCLKVGGCFGMTEEQFKELKFLLGVDNNPIQLGEQKPRFFHQGQSYLTCDDDRAIDVEVCPKCQKLKLVYDCPSESCRRTNHATQLCRACIFCIARCIYCGCCLKDRAYEETFTLDLLCFDCWKQMSSASPSKRTIFHQDERSRINAQEVNSNELYACSNMELWPCNESQLWPLLSIL